jgi:hypothetical protein
MIRKINHRKAILLGTIAMFFMTVAAQSQQQMGALMNGMAVNAKQLKRYTFKQRTETYYKTELKVAKLDEVHYNVNGERVVVPLGEQKAESGSHRRGPGFRLVAKKVEQKQEETKQYVERLMFLTSRYLAPEPSKFQAALAQADVTKSMGSSLVRIHLRDFVKGGDMMVMTVDSATNRPVKTEIETTLDGGPVSIVLTFDQIHDGPNYPGKTVVRSDAEELEVRMFTYDYRS